MRSAARSLLLPLEGLWAPGPAMDVAGSRRALLALAALLLLLAALGAASLPRLLALLGETLGGGAAAAAHADALRAGLARYLVADRLLPPVPIALAATLVAMVATPALAGRRVAGRAVCGVLAVGAAPLVVQRLGELAVVWATPAAGLVPGDVAALAARFNVGAAGLLAAVGQSPAGALSVAAEAANAIGLWVVALWGWGLARLDHDAAPAGPGLPAWPFVLAVAAYGVAYALYAVLFPYYLVLVMGAP
ncbi:MAG TPA: hypothetical protein VMF70_09745 [Gemmatimonadales bacterium]|nr:hypothetical protein [Gemmatimonadales bacterium]